MTKITNLNGRIISNSKIYYESSLKTAAELAQAGSNLEPLKKIWGSYILENSLTHNPSERGTGKTLMNLQICLAVSSCWDSFCGESIEIHGNTLFLNFELNESVIQRRMDHLFKNPPFPINQDKYQTRVYTSRLSFEQELCEISKFIQDFKPVLVVIDNFRLAFLESDGNNNKDVAQAMSQILSLRDVHNCSIVLIDHTRKNTRNQSTESDLQSGAGAKSDLADGDYFLRRSSQNEKFRILKRSKSRNCADQPGAKLLKLDPDSLWFQEEEEKVDEAKHLGTGVKVNPSEQIELAKDLYEQGHTMEQIGKLLGKGKSTISRWINGK